MTSTNVLLEQITVMPMPNVLILLAVLLVLVTMVMKVMVSHVMILMNVQEKLTTVMSLQHIPPYTNIYQYILTRYTQYTQIYT